jgi:serine/threonine protein kinase
MSYRLFVVSGPDQGKSFDIEKERVNVVGRGDATTIRLSDPAISRVHAEIKISEAGVVLTDKGSSSGTFVDGQRIETNPIKEGQKIRIGDSELRIDVSGANAKTINTTGKKAPEAIPLPKLVGQTIGPYKIGEIIGKGNSGMVFKAKDSETGEAVAIKILSPAFTATDEQRQRFVRAMKTMLPIKGDHIVRLIKAGKNGVYCWAAMEHIEGEDIATLIQKIGIEGMLDWKMVWRVAVDIAQALNTGHHHHQVIHRNVTPRNILRRSVDKACLLGDFMLAKALQGSLARQVTQPGQMLGELPYMAPERTKMDAEVDTRSDLYGLGATCYALLTGRPPAGGDTMTEIIESVRNVVPEQPKKFQLSIDELFQGIVMKLIAKDPSERYQTPNELLKELERVGKFNNLSI